MLREDRAMLLYQTFDLVQSVSIGLVLVLMMCVSTVSKYIGQATHTRSQPKQETSYNQNFQVHYYHALRTLGQDVSTQSTLGRGQSLTG
jgi:hypothetical protein